MKVLPIFSRLNFGVSSSSSTIISPGFFVPPSTGLGPSIKSVNAITPSGPSASAATIAI